MTATHHPTYYGTGRCWVVCVCGWVSRVGDEAGARLAFGRHADDDEGQR